MCGIVGYLGTSTNVKSIVDVLAKLEYRGYDSAGVCCHENKKLNAIKSVGKIEKLNQKIEPNLKSGSVIAHTRWATHGKVTEQNSHPHLSFDLLWAVVHNGIIENHQQIKDMLKTKPQSQTDTAVISQLLEENEVKDIQGFIKTLNMASGSFAIVTQCAEVENTLFIAKNKSPLYVSKNNDGNVLVASDPVCFAGFSKTYYSLNDHEFAVATLKGLAFFDSAGNVLTKEQAKLDDSFENVTKQGYEHFMFKEIEEESAVIKRQVIFYKNSQVLDCFNKGFIEKFNKVLLLGCGTAYHAGLMGAKYISKQTGMFAVAEIASEFLYEQPVFVDERTLCIFVSQSGETADTLEAMNLARSKGAFCVALTNVIYSSVAKRADLVLPVCAGPEIAVASTKAYVCQLTALYMFASHIKNQLQNQSIDFFERVEALADKILNFDKIQFDVFAQKLKNESTVIFIGKGCDFITACEASLKLKEISYINSSSYASGELKHGFLALVEKGTPVIAIAGRDKTKQKTFNAASEAESRGADVFVVSNQKIDSINGCVIDEDDELLFAVASIVPLQYLAYKVSVAKNFNPDQPRNLAKSVTVE